MSLGAARPGVKRPTERPAPARGTVDDRRTRGACQCASPTGQDNGRPVYSASCAAIAAPHNATCD